MKKIITIVLSVIVISNPLSGVVYSYNNDINISKDITESKKSNQVVNIPDINLRRALNRELHNFNDLEADITVQQLKNIKSLYLHRYTIRNLEGIQYCINLEHLNIGGGKMNDISQLASLKNLKYLNLSNVKINDISPLASLINLEDLLLCYNNQISDISPLQNLINLNYLNLSGNQISDISPLGNLTNLTELGLSENQISDISPLGNLTNLTNLGLNNNEISNISSLENLTNLTYLGLSNNKISNISSLENLTNLTDLGLSNNKISNISSLKNLINLESLNLSYNQIGDLRPLSNIYQSIKKLNMIKQTVDLGTVEINNNQVTMNIPKVYDIDGSLIAPYISDYTWYKHEIVGERIVWRDVDREYTFNVQFLSKFNIQYYMTYSQKAIKIPSDINSHWAKNTIKSFISKGYINGYQDGSFKPNNDITRAEFVKIANRVFGFTEKGTVTFNDVRSSDWFYNEIAIAQKAGYINGKSGTTFAPNDKITRQEVAVILTNIMNNKDTVYDKINTFADGHKTSEWAKSSVEGAIEAGYLNGNDKGLLNPISNITRAEAVTMLSRVR